MPQEMTLADPGAIYGSMRLPLAIALLCLLAWAWGFWARPTWREKLDECREAQWKCAYQITEDAVLYRECAAKAGVWHHTSEWYQGAYMGRVKSRLPSRTEPGAAIGPVGKP